MSFEVEGKLHKKFDTENKTDTFQAREFVIEIGEGNYPQFIKFQLTQDRCALVDNHEVGNQIKVYFDLRGREWNEKYFTNLNAWKIEGGAKAAAVPAPEGGQEAPFPTTEPVNSSTDQSNDLDDLPF